MHKAKTASSPRRQASRIAQLEEELRQLRRTHRTPREPKEGIGGTIQKMREEAGMTLRDLAEAAQLSPGLVSRVESSGHANFNLATLFALAGGLGKTPSSILVQNEENWDEPYKFA